MHILLYLCAAAVIIAGSQVLLELAVPGGRVPPWEVARVIWRRPVPPVAAGLVVLMVAMAVAQTVHPALIGDLQRDPTAVGALAVGYAVRGTRSGLRLLAVLVPIATVILCALANNHGVGLAVGCLFGLLFQA